MSTSDYPRAYRLLTSTRSSAKPKKLKAAFPSGLVTNWKDKVSQPKSTVTASKRKPPAAAKTRPAVDVEDDSGGLNDSDVAPEPAIRSLPSQVDKNEGAKLAVRLNQVR